MSEYVSVAEAAKLTSKAKHNFKNWANGCPALPGGRGIKTRPLDGRANGYWRADLELIATVPQLPADGVWQESDGRRYARWEVACVLYGHTMPQLKVPPRKRKRKLFYVLQRRGGGLRWVVGYPVPDEASPPSVRVTVQEYAKLRKLSKAAIRRMIDHGRLSAQTESREYKIVRKLTGGRKVALMRRPKVLTIDSAEADRLLLRPETLSIADAATESGIDYSTWYYWATTRCAALGRKLHATMGWGPTQDGKQAEMFRISRLEYDKVMSRLETEGVVEDSGATWLAPYACKKRYPKLTKGKTSPISNLLAGMYEQGKLTKRRPGVYVLPAQNGQSFWHSGWLYDENEVRATLGLPGKPPPKVCRVQTMPSAASDTARRTICEPTPERKENNAKITAHPVQFLEPQPVYFVGAPVGKCGPVASIDTEERMILEHLKKSRPDNQTHQVIAGFTSISEKTIGKKMERLRTIDAVTYPNGVRKGATIAPFGLLLLGGLTTT